MDREIGLDCAVCEVRFHTEKIGQAVSKSPKIRLPIRLGVREPRTCRNAATDRGLLMPSRLAAGPLMPLSPNDFTAKMKRTEFGL